MSSTASIPTISEQEFLSICDHFPYVTIHSAGQQRNAFTSTQTIPYMRTGIGGDYEAIHTNVPPEAKIVVGAVPSDLRTVLEQGDIYPYWSNGMDIGERNKDFAVKTEPVADTEEITSLKKTANAPNNDKEDALRMKMFTVPLDNRESISIYDPEILKSDIRQKAKDSLQKAGIDIDIIKGLGNPEVGADVVATMRKDIAKSFAVGIRKDKPVKAYLPNANLIIEGKTNWYAGPDTAIVVRRDNGAPHITTLSREKTHFPGSSKPLKSGDYKIDEEFSVRDFLMAVEEGINMPAIHGPEIKGISGLYEPVKDIEKALEKNTASVERWRNFREKVGGLRPDESNLDLENSDQKKAYRATFKDNLRNFTDNFSDISLERFNTQELMTLYKHLRDLEAFEDMILLYRNASDSPFQEAPIVREFLAVAYNQTNKPSEASAEALRLINQGHGNGEVYAALGKSFKLQRQAAETWQSALAEPKSVEEIANAEKNYRLAFALQSDISPPQEPKLSKHIERIKNRSRDMYHRGFMETFDYYPGINAAYGDLQLGDYKSAADMAELAHLAALRDGGLDTVDYWRTATIVEALVISGATAEEIKHPLAVLLEYEEIPHWQWNSTINTLEDIKPALEEMIAHGDDSAEKIQRVLNNVEMVTHELHNRSKNENYRLNLDQQIPTFDIETHLLLENSFSYRGMSTWDAELVSGNMKWGGPIADHMVTRRDREEFSKLLDLPLDDLMIQLGSDYQKLPEEARKKTLNQIKDTELFLKAAQVIVRTNFQTDERDMEIIDSNMHHMNFDEPLAAFNRIVGVPEDSSQLEHFDSRTSLTAEFAKGLGDCRHHAQALQLLFDTWQRRRMNDALRSAALAETPDDRAKAIADFEELRNTELRTFDIQVHAPVKIREKYKPERPQKEFAKGKTPETSFLASNENNPIEDHTFNLLLRRDRKTGTVVSTKFADSFYQNVYPWGSGEVDVNYWKLPLNWEMPVNKKGLFASKLKGVVGVENEIVDVVIEPTSYAGNRRAMTHGDVGDVWERGIPYKEFDLVKAINMRSRVERNLRIATEYHHAQTPDGSIKPASITVTSRAPVLAASKA